MVCKHHGRFLPSVSQPAMQLNVTPHAIFRMPLRDAESGLSFGNMSFRAILLRSLLPCMLAVSSSLAVATTYRWVDSAGVVHYSDRPQPGAEKVNLPPAQTYTTPAAGKRQSRCRHHRHPRSSIR